MILDHLAGLYEACQRLCPIDTAYANLPIEEGFNWSSCLGDARFEGLYLVVFCSVRRAAADLALLMEHDDQAYAAALGAGGLLRYFKGEVNGRRECLSFCLWERREQAVSASGGATHWRAAQLSAEMYESYVLERYDLVKTGGSLVFRPFEGDVAPRCISDEQAVDEQSDAVAEEAGSVDISFNAVSIRDVQLIPLAEISLEDFINPIVTGPTTHFLTARAATRHMAEKGSGVILKFAASAARAYVPGVYGVACVAIEALTKQLAAELGPRGIRAVCLRLESMPESWEGISTEAWSAPEEEIEAVMRARTLLGRVTTLADVGNAAAFLASDRAAATTGIVFNLTSGTVLDLGRQGS